MSQPRLVLSLVSLLTLAGCDSHPKVASISGTILLDGKPLVGASVNTQPISTPSNPKPGPGSFGKTDTQGRYSLELVDPPVAGAVLGEHRVTITRVESQGDDEDESAVVSKGAPWPTRYSDGSLRLTVTKEGNDQANFDLHLKP